jgi:sugar O-acyltransferase (sialic acid O-acetyltransferase NeuD family)
MEPNMAEQKVPVVILGAGGYATIIYEMLSTRDDLIVLGCTDKALGLSERSVGEDASLRILGDDDILPDLAEQHPGLRAVLALGPDLMDVRARLIRRLALEGIPTLTVIHARAFVSRLATVGAGTIVDAGAIIAAGVEIGSFCALTIGASIDHDARLGDNVFVGQGARISSYVQVSDDVTIELGACIQQRVVIGKGARITGGAFVNTDVPDHAVVIGAPARVVRYIDT